MFLSPVGGTNGAIDIDPGDTVEIEVFIRDVSPPDVRGYQASLPFEATGGNEGSVDFVPVLSCPGEPELCSPRIITTREDYAYFQVQGAFLSTPQSLQRPYP